MTRKLRFSLDLQLFAEEEFNFDGLLYDVDDPVDVFGNPIDEADENDDESIDEPGENPKDPNYKPSALDEDEETEEEPVIEEEAPADPPPAEEKPVQTPEENAKFAEQRRQREAQATLENSPEYKITKLLADQYGLTPDQLYAQMQEQALKRQAESTGVPIEFLKKQQDLEARLAQQEQQASQLQFQAWHAQKQAEGQAVIAKYNGVVTEDDVQGAIVYMLNELKTTDISLDKAVRLLHGDKIEAELRRIAKQEALAEVSGRKQAPLATQGGKSSPATNQLTADERHVARMMGISEKDYLKYKT